MKTNTILLFIPFFLLILNCSNNDDQITIEPKVLTLFGNDKSIQRLTDSLSFDDIKKLVINSSQKPVLRSEILCYPPNSDNKEEKVLLNFNNEYNQDTIFEQRSFITHIGDQYISGENDPDAIKVVNLIGDVHCLEAYHPNKYINVIFDSSVNTNWINATQNAIQAWNNAINLNPNNSQNSIFNSDTPNIYFRIASQENINDYGNITIRIDPPSEFASNPAPIAAANMGKYWDIGGTQSNLYVHSVGSYIRINASYSNRSLQVATTNMVHEIGHSLGFRHSDNSPSNIQGTTQNAYSVMYQYANTSWNTNGFFPEDYIAIDKIFNVENEWIFMDCD
ncbi:M57 family metalloprotease [Gaetbulibacter jejuensis]|uniref:Dual-action HEIGH metallo-peptidase n=1 Tax=Gaetbulibacter jejuensis TaxID=584607 RepID=A0ABN1JX57_9FLAO